MRIYSHYTRQHPETKLSSNLSVGLKNKINLLILIHLLAFILYAFIKWAGLLEHPLTNGTVGEYINYFLAVSSRAQDLRYQWSTSIFTYQFVHLDLGELLLSISMLWLFGHILQNRLSQLKIILLYFIFATLSAIIFNLSHLIFPIHSEPSGMMEGAFGGVLGLMTTTVCFYGKYKFHLGKNVHLSLWHIYVIAILLSLIFVYKNNIAYILVYAGSICAGARYAEILKKQQKEQVPNYY